MVQTTLVTLGIATAFILIGCEAPLPKPAYFNNINETVSKGTALISRWGYLPIKDRYGRGEHAEVATVDGEQIVYRSGLMTIYIYPLPLVPGRHFIEIDEKETLFCAGGMFGAGCFYSTPATRSIELVAEAGHLYTPQATKRCGKDWIWIEDNGEVVKDFLSARKKNEPYEPPLSKVIAGGEAPPACSDTESE